MIELFGSLEVMRFSLTGPLLRPQVVEILARFQRSYVDDPLSPWGVVERATNGLCGICGFLRGATAGMVEWELSYRFTHRHWGRGLATEAASACRDIAFRTPGVERIVALIEESNTASIRVATKVGLQFSSQIPVLGLPVLEYTLNRPMEP